MKDSIILVIKWLVAGLIMCLGIVWFIEDVVTRELNRVTVELESKISALSENDTILTEQFYKNDTMLQDRIKAVEIRIKAEEDKPVPKYVLPNHRHSQGGVVE